MTQHYIIVSDNVAAITTHVTAVTSALKQTVKLIIVPTCCCRYFAARGGVVYLDIWRRRGRDLVLVGSNRIVCEGYGRWVSLIKKQVFRVVNLGWGSVG